MMGEFFVGILAHADDTVLLARAPNAMRIMLAMCDSFAKDCNINASNTKCLYCTVQAHDCILVQTLSSRLTANLLSLLCVHLSQWLHLGHIISSIL